MQKALQEADGDIEAAVDVLRTRGLAAAAKKAGRATNEGLIVAAVAADGRSAALSEVNCETDFVSRNEVFSTYANRVAQAVLAADPADQEALNAVQSEGQDIAAMITEAIQIIGENIQISRFTWRSIETGLIASYIHAGGRLGVLVRLKTGQQATAELAEVKTLAKDIAMQVAAANPAVVTRDGYPADAIEREMAIYKAQAAESGKSEEIQTKMAEGRLEKYYRETVLNEQEFVKDPDKSIKQVVEACAKAVGDQLEIIGFDRFELGQS